jgi:hypothetical protein
MSLANDTLNLHLEIARNLQSPALPSTVGGRDGFPVMIRKALVPMLLTLAVSACAGEGETRPEPVDACVREDAAAEIHCFGEPVPCDAFDLDVAPNCEAHAGCIAERECRANYAFSCYDLPTISECTEVGCTWTSSCQGPNGCIIEENQVDCEARAGCVWDSYCDPLSSPSDTYCAQFADDSGCSTHDACEWGYLTCSGTPVSCAMLTSEDACTTQAGCDWQP